MTLPKITKKRSLKDNDTSNNMQPKKNVKLAEADSSDEELENFLFGKSSVSKTEEIKEEEHVRNDNDDKKIDQLLSFSISTKPSHFDDEKLGKEEKLEEKVCISTTFLQASTIKL